MSRPYTAKTLMARTMLTEDGCLEWQGCKSKYGYGRTLWYGKDITTHRLSYMLNIGDIPVGKHILHSCDNPPCINPAHLRPGTHAENMQDMAERGRRIHLSGEQNPASKLKYKDVETIRKLLSKGVRGRDVAKLFPVSEATIYHIKNGRIWKRGYDYLLEDI